MKTAYGQSANGWALAGVAALHALAVLALLSIEPVAQAVGLPKPLMVSLLTTTPEPPPEPPKPLPPKPRVLPQPVQRELPSPPVLALPETAAIARPVEATPMPPEPLPAVLPPRAPEPVKPVAAYAPPATAPAPVVPPRFDADYLDNPAPAYPSLSRRLGEEGRVLLRVFVDPDGSAARVEVRDSSGFERLDKVARDTVGRWRFVPARQGDKAVGAWVLVPISFSLRS
jgi:protein TonB